MKPHPKTESTQAARMQAAIHQAIAVGPSFLRGDIDADQMAYAMLQAVQHYVEEEQATGGDGVPHGAQAQELLQVIQELKTCGSGYLAKRCDAACVARTMTHLVHRFGQH